MLDIPTTIQELIERSEVKVDLWWQDVTSPYEPMDETFFTDTTVAWSISACEIVFMTNGLDSVRLSDKNKEDILSEIFSRFNYNGVIDTPEVSFEWDKVRISSLSPSMLDHFWLSPPGYKGETMRVFSRGLPWLCASMFLVEGLPSMPEHQLRCLLDDPMAFNVDQPLKVIARLYAVGRHSEDPMFSGELIAVWSDDCLHYDTPTCFGKAMKKLDTAGVSDDLTAPLMRHLSVLEEPLLGQ